MIGLFKKLNVPNVVIYKNGDSVPFVDEVLSLGVILDSILSWKQQANHVSKKVNRVFYGLRFIKSSKSQTLRRRLVVRVKEPPFLLPLFKPYFSDKPQRRPCKDLAVPTVSTDFGLLFYQVKYANLWNSII